MNSNINIIDLFAGPGGLGEGFSSLKVEGINPFKIRMSVEKETSAHATLTLRAFYRILNAKNDTKLYFDYVEGRINKSELIELRPEEWSEALVETLSQPRALGEDNVLIHGRLLELKKKYSGEPWVVIGGPPCQAYSLVGRARNKSTKGYKASDDPRHFLYREYLKVLSIMQPDVFIMENVKGILSSSPDGTPIFPLILKDLKNPSLAIENSGEGKNYKIISLVKEPINNSSDETVYKSSGDFVIRAENYGIPQARHRVILVGVSHDLIKSVTSIPQLEQQNDVNIEHVIKGLPVLRSKLSKEKDTPENWLRVIKENIKLVVKQSKNNKLLKPVIEEMKGSLKQLRYDAPTRSETYEMPGADIKLPYELRDWLLRNKPSKVLNHESRGHMNSDLGRYLFSACWAMPSVMGATDKPFPKSEDYPDCLAPNHANWNSGKFADRFRVQRYGRPATTITSHISKDGHYFIHPDPTQCRSLTVREAARIQTFPDNYLFEGTRTQQYVQVGNAVPPYLALKISKIVNDLINMSS